MYNILNYFHDDLDDSGVHNLNLSLPSTSAIEVCKYIRNNISANTIYQNGYSFNVLVNGADFFSGTIYSDGGSTWWGTIQQRGGSIDGNTIYKYLYIGGADSVTPFKSSLSTITTAAQGLMTPGSSGTIPVGCGVGDYILFILCPLTVGTIANMSVTSGATTIGTGGVGHQGLGTALFAKAISTSVSLNYSVSDNTYYSILIMK